MARRGYYYHSTMLLRFKLSRIYGCEGKHFKVYNNELREVLEHPSEEKPVSVDFSYNKTDLVITVTGFIKKKMRISNQKDRGDIYILQNQFSPLLPSLCDLLKRLSIDSEQGESWRFGNPQERMGRQGVPKLRKLAEVRGVSLEAPFDAYVFSIENANLVVDSEIPGIAQTKWRSEGGERQIHLGVFGYHCGLRKRKMPQEVVINIPLKKLENSFLKPIQKNWID